MANRLPTPSRRISSLLSAADAKHTQVNFASIGERLPGFGHPKSTRAWRYDFAAQVMRKSNFDILNLYEGDDAARAAIRRKIEDRKILAISREKDPRELIFEVLQELGKTDWDWKIFGVRFVDLTRTGSSVRTLSRIYRPQELEVTDIPHQCNVMIFAGEEKARIGWNLTMIAQMSKK